MTARSTLRFGGATLGALTLLAAIPWAACSSDSTPSDTGTASTSASSSGAGGSGGSGGAGGGTPDTAIEVRFELPATGSPDFLAVPFPSDLYLDATGHVGDIPNMAAYMANSTFITAALAPFDGFGRTAGSIFEIDDHSVPKLASGATAAPEIDDMSLPQTEADSVAATASVMLVDLGATSPATALIPARSAYRDDRSLGAKTLPKLVIYPARGIVLSEKHQYAAVVTTSVKTTTAKSITASVTFAGIRDGVNRTTAAEKLYGTAVDKVAVLVPSLADKTKIAAISVFTTNGASQELIDLRAQFAAAAPPILHWDAATIMPMGVGLFADAPLPAGYVATLDAWLGTPAKLPDNTDDPAADQLTGIGHDAIAAVGTAEFDAPNVLLQATKGYADPSHQTFARDASGKPMVNPMKPTSKIWATIILPKGAVPATGFPTVIVQHGLAQERSYILALADTFAKRGWATVGIETVTFGARAAEAADTVDKAAVFAWSKGAGAYNGPDGFVDVANGSSDFFGALKAVGALRDQLRQSVLDIGTLGDVLSNAALDLGPLTLAVPGAKLDATRLAFIGTSLGGIMGAEVAALDPRLKTLVLNVAGGGIVTELGANSPTLSSSVSLALGINFEFNKNRFAPGHPLMHILQQAIDPGDPLAFADRIIQNPVTINGKANPPKNILQIEVLWDDYVPNEANEALARAAGFPLAGPSVGAMTGIPFVDAMPVNGMISGVPMTGITAVLVQASPGTHGADLGSAEGNHHYKIPYAQFDTATPFTTLTKDFKVAEPYLGLQTMMTTFFTGAFSGVGAPSVQGFPTPTLDYDGDGYVNSSDADPNDPTVH